MDHRNLSYPILVWGEDYVFLAKNYHSIENTPRSQYERIKSQSNRGNVKLLTSDGDIFTVSDRVIISTNAPILRWIVGFRTAPILKDGRRIDLDEYKKLISKAVQIRQRGDYDSNYFGELTAALPHATTYAEAMDCVPKAM